MAKYWYGYVGGTGGNLNDPANYRLLSNQGIPGTSPCLAGTVICAIKAPDGDLFPLAPFSANILQYIMDSNSVNVPLPQGVGNKKYLYKKNLS